MGITLVKFLYLVFALGVLQIYFHGMYVLD